MKFRGANVTIPYKTEFFNADGSPRLVDELSEISKFTGSVNTLYWKDGIVGGTLRGTTTDPYGCIRNLEENGVDRQTRRLRSSETAVRRRRSRSRSWNRATRSPSCAARQKRARRSPTA